MKIETMTPCSWGESIVLTITGRFGDMQVGILLDTYNHIVSVTGVDSIKEIKTVNYSKKVTE